MQSIAPRTRTNALSGPGYNAATIKAQIDHVSFYSRELGMEIKDTGTWTPAGLCPFHNDTRAGNFYVKMDGGFYCHSCHSKGGDIFDFLMRRHGITFTEAKNSIARAEGLSAHLSPEQHEVLRQRNHQVRQKQIANELDHNALVIMIGMRQQQQGIPLSPTDADTINAAKEDMYRLRRELHGFK